LEFFLPWIFRIDGINGSLRKFQDLKIGISNAEKAEPKKTLKRPFF